EVDFSETDLSNAVFNNCDLIGSIFKTSILEKTDFRTSYNYSIDPELNRMKKAKFSLQGLPGLLRKYQIEVE
ncbi:MAG TPA: pentapeptide repeat-containing protein, partial [Lutibacter sp.]|nr:pentapeptide repeat-containing protein [Lutibacter sp.]